MVNGINISILTNITDESIADYNVVVKLTTKYDIKNRCLLWDLDRNYIKNYSTEEDKCHIALEEMINSGTPFIHGVIPYSWVTKRQLIMAIEILESERVIRL